MSVLFVTRVSQGSYAVELRTGNPTGQPGVGTVKVLAHDVSARAARDTAEDNGASFEAAQQMVDLARMVGLAFIDVPA